MPKKRPMYRDSMAIGCLGNDIGWEYRQKELSELGVETYDRPGKGLEELSKKDTLKMLYMLGHGRLSQNPFDANITLKDRDDAVITITGEELLRWKIKVDFVFLNSCDTGSGDAYGKDIYGFPFCIMGAGNASCLIAAIDVDKDFANSFAIEIFKNLKETQVDRTTALAKAIRKNITNPLKPAWTHPSYWAPYFFYGDFRPL